MQDFDIAGYHNFLSVFRKKLGHIAYSTRGEYQHADVEGEALLMALEIRDKYGVVLDFGNPGFLQLLFSHLYQRLVRHTETTVRYAVKLDHGTGEDEEHPLAKTLVADHGDDPLTLLLAKESATWANGNVAAHPSLAAAYVRLLENFNYHVRSVAAHLLLSVSYCYKRMSDARWLAVHQLPLEMPLPDDRFTPGPWRSFKLKRPHEQRAFDFCEAQVLTLG